MQREGGMQTFWEENSPMDGLCGSYFDNSPRAPLEVPRIGGPFGEKALQQKLQLLVEDSDMNWTYVIFWRTPSSLTAEEHLGWGDGYCKSPDASEIKAIKQAKKGSDVDKKQYQRRMFLHSLQADEELQALISGDGDDESSTEHVTTDTEWLYMLSTYCVFAPAVETFATRNHVWLLSTEGEAFATKNYSWLEGTTPSNIMTSTRGDLLTMANIRTLVYVHTGSGVVELGSTKLIPERDDIIANIKMRFFERNDDNGTSLAPPFWEQESFSLPPDFSCPPHMDMYELRLQQELDQQLLATSSVMQGDEDSTAATTSNVDIVDCLSSDEFEIADKIFDNEEVQVIRSTFFGAKEKTKPSVHAHEQPHVVADAAESLYFPDVSHVMDVDTDSQVGDLTTFSTVEGPHEGAKHHQGFPPSKQWGNIEGPGTVGTAYSPSHMDSEQEVELEPEATYYEEAENRVSLMVDDPPPRKRGRKRKNDSQEPISHKDAESLRRKKMKKQETALRAVVPNVTKADRASLISAAISHILKLESDLASVKLHKSELEAQQKERIGAGGEFTSKGSRSSVQRTISFRGSSMPSGTSQQPTKVNVNVMGLQALIRMESTKSCRPASLLSSLEEMKLEIQHASMSVLTESTVDHSVLVKMGKDNVYTGEQILAALERTYQRRRNQPNSDG